MGTNSAIQWTDHTFNPWRGCTKVSQGCKNCYAETLSARNPSVLGIWGPKGSRPVAAESYWKQPEKWDREAKEQGVRKRVFCASLADVFEGPETMPADAWEDVELARLRLWAWIEATPNLDWLILTKRPENFWKVGLSFFGGPGLMAGGMPENAWIGTSVEDQKTADERIPELLKIPATVRFLSCEPLIGSVQLDALTCGADFDAEGAGYYNSLKGKAFELDGEPGQSGPSIDWVICGGESGHGARPMHPDWARSLRDQCVSAGVPYFFKQWGEWAPESNLNPESDRLDHISLYNAEYHVFEGGGRSYKIGKKRAGRLLDGREWNEFPGVS